MRSHRSRALTREERALWAHVLGGVTPLPGRVRPADPDPPAASRPDTGTEPARASDETVRHMPAAPPPLAPLDPKLRTGLRRGTHRAEAVIDLHGMTQREAHDALLGFLHRAHGAGRSLVLVVTGKGGAGPGAGPFEERGVLRRVVPHWLRRPDLRPLVLGFEEASPRHGGAGALYVRLRRGRAAGAGP